VIKYGSYTLDIKPNKKMWHDYSMNEYMYLMNDGVEYSILVSNMHLHNPCKMVLKIDGKVMGTYKVDVKSKYQIERPVEEKKKFTFVYIQDKLKGGGATEKGVVEASFYPQMIQYPSQSRVRGARFKAGEVNLQSVPESDGTGLRRRARASSSEMSSSSSDYSHDHKHKKSHKSDYYEEKDESSDSLLMGETLLQGTSNQVLNEIDDFDVDPSRVIIIRARLVGST